MLRLNFLHLSGSAMNLSGKVAVITGSASGIGAACARAFSERGAKVAIVDRNATGAAQIAKEIGGLAVSCDVASEQDINALVRTVEEKLGPIDIFFNNAGVATGGDPLTTPIDVWDAQWQINVMSHVYAIRAVLPGMLQRGSGICCTPHPWPAFSPRQAMPPMQ